MYLRQIKMMGKICFAVSGVLLLLSLVVIVDVICDNDSTVQKNIENMGGTFLDCYEYDFSIENNRIKGFIRPTQRKPILSKLKKQPDGDIVYVQLKIQDDDIKLFEKLQLYKLTNLRHLHLSGRGIDVNIIDELRTLSNLKSLDLCYTSLSKKDIDDIQSALPGVAIRITDTP